MSTLVRKLFEFIFGELDTQNYWKMQNNVNFMFFLMNACERYVNRGYHSQSVRLL